MEKLWWMKKREPAQDYEDDVNGYYYGNPEPKEESLDEDVEEGYDNYENGDISGIQVALSGDPVKEVAKAEPLMKRSFAPKTCQDSQVIVDAYKEGRVIIVCVEELDRENFLRLFDYIMGAVQALDGELRRLDRDTVALLPYGVDAELDIEALEEETVEEEAVEDGKDAE